MLDRLFLGQSRSECAAARSSHSVGSKLAPVLPFGRGGVEALCIGSEVRDNRIERQIILTEGTAC
jgi:hypothetical protein